MATYNVKFLKGSADGYANLAVKDVNTFYYVDEKDLYLGNTKLSNAADVEAAVSRIAANEGAISSLQTLVTKLDGDASVDGSIKKQIADAVAGLAAVARSGAAADVTVKDDAGHFDATDVESALAELATDIGSAQTAGAVTVENAATTDEGDSSTYIVKQGGTEVGRIHFAKDMVATSGELVTNPEGQPAGTYIKMTIANGDPFYINVASLIEYNSVGNTAEIALSEDADHKITGTIVEVSGSKLTDGTVTKAKLDDAVQISLGKADTALQDADKTELEGKISDEAATARAAEKANKDAIDAINNTNTGILKQAKDYADGKDVSIEAAKDAADAAQSDVDALKTVVGKDAVGNTPATGMKKDIADLKAFVGEGGSVDSKIDTAIQGLDSTQSQTAGTDGLALSITETDGKIESISGSIAPNTYDAHGAATTAEQNAKNYADGLAGNYATAAQGKKADSAVQTVATGATNGSIAVDGKDVTVKGLGTAAYSASTAFDKAGAAKTAETNAKAYTDEALTWGTF